MDLDTNAAVVVLSGGQDSTICLAWAQRRFARVAAITFDYGQRHRVELGAAHAVAAAAQVMEHKVLRVSSLAELGGNALTSDEAVTNELREKDGLPNTFVPGRNLVFMTLAAAWAYQIGAAELVTGVCQTDFSGYPDCRAATMAALQTALREGMAAPFTIHTPLMDLSKAESVHLAQEVDAMELLAYSHTCYNGAIPPCGTCPACELRAKGFAEAGVADPLLERLGQD
ncbi:MAG: 7-cyano-7-deazaguanine synthase QueC [Planctomycetota bacterium]|jgi:7-cyano-7-deazaguanine synthase|nr:7-cyano-7-deazaguanine synthase QueC [Planctomycetota bacterium]